MILYVSALTLHNEQMIGSLVLGIEDITGRSVIDVIMFLQLRTSKSTWIHTCPGSGRPRCTRTRLSSRAINSLAVCNRPVYWWPNDGSCGRTSKRRTWGTPIATIAIPSCGTRAGPPVWSRASDADWRCSWRRTSRRGRSSHGKIRSLGERFGFLRFDYITITMHKISFSIPGN